jgi:hypothetical protein
MAKKIVTAFKVPTKPSTAPKIDTRPSKLEAAITDEDLATINSTLTNQSFAEPTQDLENRGGETPAEVPQVAKNITDENEVVKSDTTENPSTITDGKNLETEISEESSEENPMEEIPVIVVASRGRKTTRKKKGEEISQGPGKYFALNIDVKYKQLLKFLATTKQVTLIELVAQIIDSNPDVKQMKQLMKGMSGDN